jgi:hypothetical protein
VKSGLTNYGPLTVCLETKPEVCGMMEEEMICENFEHRIQMIGKIRLLSSYYLVFRRIY